MKSSIKVEKFSGKVYRSVDYDKLERRGFKFVTHDAVVNLEKGLAMLFAGEDRKRRVKSLIPLEGAKRLPKGVKRDWLLHLKEAAQWIEEQEKEDEDEERYVVYEEPVGYEYGALAGFKVMVEQHGDVPSPVRDWDMLGTFVGDYKNEDFYHEKWYSLEYFEDEAIENGWEYLKIGHYNGWVYCTPEKGQKEYGKRWRKKARLCMEAEIKTMGEYCDGEVYGYRVVDKDGEDVASCWGYIGESKRAGQSGMDHMRWLVEENVKNKFNL